MINKLHKNESHDSTNTNTFYLTKQKMISFSHLCFTTQQFRMKKSEVLMSWTATGKKWNT